MFAKALSDAKAVLADENATQSSVDHALQALNAALVIEGNNNSRQNRIKTNPDNKKPVKTGDPTSVFGIF